MEPWVAYRDAEDRLRSSVRIRDFPLALVAIKDGLRAAPATYAHWRSKGYILRQVPGSFTGTTAGAIVALHNDQEAFQLMALVAVEADVPVEIDRFRGNAETVRAVRAYLSRVHRASLFDLKGALPDHLRVDVSRLVDWMAKNGELRLEGTGASRVAHWGGATDTVKPSFPAVLEGRTIIPSSSTAVITGSHAALSARAFLSRPDGHLLRSAPLPPRMRQSGVMRTQVVGDRVWLIGRPRKSLNQLAWTTDYAITDGVQEALEHGVFDYGVVRSYSNGQRDSVSVLDYDTNVRSYRSDGSFGYGISLAKFENLTVAAEAHGGENYSLVRSVDLHRTTGELALAIAGEFFRLDSNGEPTLAIRFDRPSVDSFVICDDPEEEDPYESGMDQDASEPDWVYFAQFSLLDGSVYVGTYSGELFKFDSMGCATGQWSLNAAVTSLHETSDSLLVATRNSVYRVSRDRVSHAAYDFRDAFLWKGYFIGRQGQEIDILDTHAWNRQAFRAPAPIRAVYPHAGVLLVDQGTTCSRITLP